MFAPPIVITGPNFHFFARRQAEEIGVEATVVIEPMRRDSGAGHRGGDRGRRQPRPAGRGAGARRRPHHSRRRRNSAPLASPAAPAAEAGRIVTFGIKPTEPKTSYGYILPGEADRQRRRARGQALRREAGRRDRRPLRTRRLFVEFRQLPFPRRRVAIRTRAARAGDGDRDQGGGRQGQQRSRLPAPAIRKPSRARRRNRSTMR